MTRGLCREWGLFVAAALFAGVGFVALAVVQPTAAQARAERALVACVQQRGFTNFVVLVSALAVMSTGAEARVTDLGGRPSRSLGDARGHRFV